MMRPWHVSDLASTRRSRPPSWSGRSGCGCLRASVAGSWSRRAGMDRGW